MRLRAAVLLLGFAAAVVGRAAVSGAAGAHSVPGGLLFGAVLLAAVAGTGTAVRVSARAVAMGAAGVLVLCLPVLLTWAPRVVPVDGLLRWSAVVSVVAVAEELFLRGTLYDAVRAVAGDDGAIAVTAVCFGLLHLPLYGWGAVPLDVCVGVLLGELRRVAGTPVAPAVTHAGADLVAWFLR